MPVLMKSEVAHARGTRARFVLFAVLPVLLGGLVYVCFRPTNLLLFDWATAAGLSGAVGSLRTFMAPLGPWLPGWAIHSAPAGLWGMALVATVALIWRGEIDRRACAYLTIAIATACGSEVLQWTGHMPGTFDPVDLAAYILGASVGLLALAHPPFLLHRKRHELEI